MNGMAKISLVLVIVLVSLSAYLRLAHSGIGCLGWPQCYGHIGASPSVSEPVSSKSAYQRILEEGQNQANQPLSWATPLHRVVASVLGLLILGLVFLSLRQKRQRIVAISLLVLTIFLAVIGMRSGGLHNPAVVMGNLAGGFLMLGLLGWMVFSQAESRTIAQGNPLIKGGAVLAIAALSLQIFLGGLTSANFAATACRTLPDCHGSWLPDNSLVDVFDLSREHEVTGMGMAVGGMERVAIHKTHRLGAVLTALLTLISAVMALRAGARYRNTGIFILLMLVLEFSVGVGAILTSLPIGLAVAHNWLAGLLLLGLLKLLALSR